MEVVATQVRKQKRTGQPERIIEVAISIIGERGYYGFSIKDIAEKCDLTVAGVLYHFGTKESILHAVIAQREAQDTAANWQDVLESGLDGLAALSLDDWKKRLHDTVLRNSQQPDILRLFSMLRTEALYQQHPAYEFFHDRAVMASKALSLGLAGKCPDPRSTARQILSAMTGLENVWLEQGMEFDLVEEWDRMAEKLLGQAE
jgi:AcrR family transcriptional regulator